MAGASLHQKGNAPLRLALQNDIGIVLPAHDTVIGFGLVGQSRQMPR